MSLDFEYGINTGNRFLSFVDHDEDPEDFIARQAQPEEKPKKSSKDVKAAANTATKKKITTTTTATASTSNVSGNTTKTNKENLTGKSTNTDQRRQPQSNVLSDSNNQPVRPESGRGGGRGFSRRGGGAGQDRPPYEGGSRGDGQPRAQRFNKFEGQQTPTETGGWEQSGEGWSNDTGNDNQQVTSHRGRGRGRGRGNYEGGRGNYEGGRGNYEGGRGNYEGGRGNYEGGRGNYEGGRGGGRGRGNYEGGRGNYEGGRGTYEGGRGTYEGGRGNYEGGRGNYEGGRGNYEGGRGRGRGRGNFNNRNFEEGSQQQQQQQTQESSGWEQSTDSNFDNTAPQSARTAGQEFDTDVSAQERPFEAGSRRGGRGNFRSRTFHNNRNYGSDRPNQYEREGDQEDYRHNRRQHDRQPRSNVSGVKPIEKKDGEGAHNWGSPTENPDDNPVVDETADTTGQGAPAPKDWAQQVDEAEKQMTLDEYKKQIEEKKRAQQEKLPQFNRRAPGEGEDPKSWKPFAQEYRKKNEGEELEEEDAEEGSGEEGNESGEENEEEQHSGKKKIITIPLRFKPIEIPRGGSAGSRGGPRRGGRFRDRPNYDDHARSKSPNQQQSSFYQQTGENQNDEQQSRPYRGGPGRGSGRGEYRRSYGNSARGSRGSYNRSMGDSNTPDFGNTIDFPTLLK